MGAIIGSKEEEQDTLGLVHSSFPLTDSRLPAFYQLLAMPVSWFCPIPSSTSQNIAFKI